MVNRNSNYGFLPLEEAIKKMPENELAEALCSLPKKDCDVLRLRLGIGTKNGEKYSFARIGELIGVKTRAYPSQVYAKVLKMLRNPIRYQYIRKYVEEYNG